MDVAAYPVGDLEAGMTEAVEDTEAAEVDPSLPWPPVTIILPNVMIFQMIRSRRLAICAINIRRSWMLWISCPNPYQLDWTIKKMMILTLGEKCPINAPK